MAKQQMQIAGLDQLVRNMNTLQDKTIKKATRAGINAGLTPLSKAIKKGVDNTSINATLKRSAKKVVGKSLKKRRGQYVGKAGFAVGKPSKGKKLTAHERYVAGQGGMGILSGVGLSASNVHWFVLGTKERFRNMMWRTGKIKPTLKNVVPIAAVTSSPAIAKTTKKKIAETIEREAAKMRK